MKKLLVIASLMAASPVLADPVLVPIDPPPAWPLMARLARPHSDETPACEARAAIEKWAPEEPRQERRHRHWRHRRHHR